MSTLPIPLPCLLSGRTLTLKGILRWSVVRGPWVNPRHRRRPRAPVIFVIAPLALSPLVPPGPGPVDLINAVRAPFHVHPSYSVAMFVVQLHPKP